MSEPTTKKPLLSDAPQDCPHDDALLTETFVDSVCTYAILREIADAEAVLIENAACETSPGLLERAWTWMTTNGLGVLFGESLYLHGLSAALVSIFNRVYPSVFAVALVCFCVLINLFTNCVRPVFSDTVEQSIKYLRAELQIVKPAGADAQHLSADALSRLDLEAAKNLLRARAAAAHARYAKFANAVENKFPVDPVLRAFARVAAVPCLPVLITFGLLCLELGVKDAGFAGDVFVMAWMWVLCPACLVLQGASTWQRALRVHGVRLAKVETGIMGLLQRANGSTRELFDAEQVGLNKIARMPRDEFLRDVEKMTMGNPEAPELV